MGGLKLIGDWLKISRSGELVAYVFRLGQSQILLVFEAIIELLFATHRLSTHSSH